MLHETLLWQIISSTNTMAVEHIFNIMKAAITNRFLWEQFLCLWLYHRRTSWAGLWQRHHSGMRHSSMSCTMHPQMFYCLFIIILFLGTSIRYHHLVVFTPNDVITSVCMKWVPLRNVFGWWEALIQLDTVLFPVFFFVVMVFLDRSVHCKC